MATVAVAGTMIAVGMAIAAGAATVAGMATAAGAVTVAGTGHIGVVPIMAGAIRAAGLNGAGITACASAAEPSGIFGAAAAVAARLPSRILSLLHSNSVT